MVVESAFWVEAAFDVSEGIAKTVPEGTSRFWARRGGHWGSLAKRHSYDYGADCVVDAGHALSVGSPTEVFAIRLPIPFPGDPWRRQQCGLCRAGRLVEGCPRPPTVYPFPPLNHTHRLLHRCMSSVMLPSSQSFTGGSGMRYNRGDLQSTLTAACDAARRWGRTAYVFGTAFGLLVERFKPPFKQDYYEATAGGTVTFHEFDPVGYNWSSRCIRRGMDS